MKSLRLDAEHTENQRRQAIRDFKEEYCKLQLLAETGFTPLPYGMFLDAKTEFYGLQMEYLPGKDLFQYIIFEECDLSESDIRHFAFEVQKSFLGYSRIIL